MTPDKVEYTKQLFKNLRATMPLPDYADDLEKRVFQLVDERDKALDTIQELKGKRG